MNDSIVGQAKTKKDIATFKIPYAPGTLKAVALQGGQPIGTAERVSAGSDLKLTLTPEEAPCENAELVFIHVDITDGAGTIESNVDSLVTVNIEGGELVAFGSAKQDPEERYHTGTFPTLYGRALAVVRKGDGEVRLTATSESGLSGETTLK